LSFCSLAIRPPLISIERTIELQLTTDNWQLTTDHRPQTTDENYTK